jgi:hypothetical protein
MFRPMFYYQRVSRELYCISTGKLLHLSGDIKERKRKSKDLKGYRWATASNVKLSTFSRKSIPERRHDGSITQTEGQHFPTDVPSHPEQRVDITPPLEEGRNVQHGNSIDLDAPALCQDDVVESYETPREAEVRERQRTKDGGKYFEALALDQ